MTAYEAAVARLREWEDSLRAKGCLRDAETLANEVLDPRTASPAQAWQVLWDKPLYANARVKTAKRWKGVLDQHLAGAWRSIGAGGDLLDIARLERRNGRQEFSAEGRLVPIARDGETRIALKRLYSIQGAAEALRHWETTSPDAPARGLADVSLETLIPKLINDLGWGWGHTTVLHFLTDLGLAVKPDRHLVRALRELGLFDGPERPVATRAEALEINRVARRLAAGFGDGPKALRYVDKVLMDSSRCLLSGQCHD